ncbi:MAG: cell division ATPase MinD [Candidatus Aenigmatarchaeota archaeon]
MKIISVASGKGGVGKTTITANLSVALSNLGFKVTAIDLNLTTPNLGFQFGYYLPEVGLHEILKNLDKLEKGIYIHSEGLKVIPGNLNIESLYGIDLSNLDKLIYKLNSDFVLLDSAAGLGREALASLNSATDILVVTNPEITALTDALRLVKIAENLNKNIIGIALNRVGRSKNEIKKEEVERFLGYEVLAEIPEDKWVVKSIEERVPVLYLNPNCRASIEITNLAYAILGTTYRVKQSFWSKIFSWI